MLARCTAHLRSGQRLIVGERTYRQGIVTLIDPTGEEISFLQHGDLWKIWKRTSPRPNRASLCRDPKVGFFSLLDAQLRQIGIWLLPNRRQEGTTPSMGEASGRWQRLLALAAEVRGLAPWDFMTEADNFAVVLPAPYGVGLVSVMGAGGEHFAVALYLGPRAIFDFWGLLAGEGGDEPEAVLEIDQLQLSWEGRSVLDRRDRQLLADLGVKPRGSHAWPMLRRYRAGYFPWFAHDDEVAMMITALEQLLVMAPRIRCDRAILSAPPDRHCLLRYPASPSSPPADWSERFESFPLAEDLHITVVIDPQRMTRVAALPLTAIEIELDLFAAPMMRIDGKSEGVAQPYYPYMLLGVERRRGLIIGFETLTALQGLEQMWPEIPRSFADLLIGAACRPARIVVHRPLLAKLLAPFCDETGIALRLVRELKTLATARRHLDEMAVR